ncbi:hypothetical protein SARC_07571 [Sphaeroforma arctica JP610]|uniref:Uncharacterized protein n=1 Tax=Sphaeroforma arctica JP610 TaxID=667725 RepID=A0A0L0FTF6_9EUKA|nr:hypothetical protein SARC_07571 [Sphaeroforma arctica JP610]KNC80062.1 hypothetical protein SARC_07571 [Sphaeroforma arctica JP610]|eukprot:XP_014153964.1 hypothetical protein SARC_07571 [Sphaeroforma arctica JP610]
MTNIRQSRRQQHLTPEQRERDDIHQRGFRRRNQDRADTEGDMSDDLEAEHRTNQAILQRTLTVDVDFTDSDQRNPEPLRVARWTSHTAHQRAKSPSPDNLQFCIRGADQTRHGVGYTSSDQEEDGTWQEPLSFQSFAQAQQRATQNPHGREALEIRRDNLETSLQAQRQGQQFVRETMDDSLTTRRMLERTPSSQVTSADKRRRLAQQITPPTPDSIAADRQALHARMLKLSEELCSAVEKNVLPRAEALRGVLETLRATHNSRPANKPQ